MIKSQRSHKNQEDDDKLFFKALGDDSPAALPKDHAESDVSNYLIE